MSRPGYVQTAVSNSRLRIQELPEAVSQGVPETGSSSLLGTGARPARGRPRGSGIHAVFAAAGGSRAILITCMRVSLAPICRLQVHRGRPADYRACGRESHRAANIARLAASQPSG